MQKLVVEINRISKKQRLKSSQSSLKPQGTKKDLTSRSCSGYLSDLYAAVPQAIDGPRAEVLQAKQHVRARQRHELDLKVKSILSLGQAAWMGFTPGKEESVWARIRNRIWVL